MRPKIYKIRPTGDLENVGEELQYVIDFQLDCFSSFMKIKKLEGLFLAEMARCDDVLSKLTTLLNSITANHVHPSLKVKIDVSKILDLLTEELTYFSPKNRKRGLNILTQNLKIYLQ